MTENMQERCTIDHSNPFWLHYLSLEKSLKDISEYIAINKDNSQSYSFKNMQLYFATCTEIDSIFKHIRDNLHLKKIERPNIGHHINMIKDYFPKIEETILTLNISGFDLDFQPFCILFDNAKTEKNNEDVEKNSSYEGWWKDYNAIKHQRPENFNKANLDNLLNSFAALHILNLIYAISLEENLVPIYDTVLIQANALRDYPFFQVKGSEVIRYVGGGGNFYGCYLSNKHIYSAD